MSALDAVASAVTELQVRDVKFSEARTDSGRHYKQADVNRVI